jgi:hypothetical protein
MGKQPGHGLSPFSRCSPVFAPRPPRFAVGAIHLSGHPSPSSALGRVDPLPRFNVVALERPHVRRHQRLDCVAQPAGSLTQRHTPPQPRRRPGVAAVVGLQGREPGRHARPLECPVPVRLGRPLPVFSSGTADHRARSGAHRSRPAASPPAPAAPAPCARQSSAPLARPNRHRPRRHGSRPSPTQAAEVPRGRSIAVSDGGKPA